MAGAYALEHILRSLLLNCFAIHSHTHIPVSAVNLKRCRYIYIIIMIFVSTIAKLEMIIFSGKSRHKVKQIDYQSISVNTNK